MSNNTQLDTRTKCRLDNITVVSFPCVDNKFQSTAKLHCMHKPNMLMIPLIIAVISFPCVSKQELVSKVVDDTQPCTSALTPQKCYRPQRGIYTVKTILHS